MGTTFAEKFEEALAEKRKSDPTYGLRTLARDLANGEPEDIEVIRRRLYKYRPPKGGGAAEVAPTPPTRWEIEDALGLERDALRPDVVDHSELLTELQALAAPHRRAITIFEQLEREVTHR